ncbi:hypothetical protein FisN_37Lh019 [Fistulifera solaris]|uniref:Uncharacterized protein n=1 Tax=Fistulifera solaris TaxID=1519565 RepID=A0A1Z5K0T7_FISSO|nr:hypothetical protein FisN_37Lh019 [Fistulifera solaris]|eukprot:GAX19752.1 hypothetical protein FisN_37Lh019 [Fistulifera solaris]
MQVMQGRTRSGISVAAGFFVLVIYLGVSTPLLYLRTLYPLIDNIRIHPNSAKPFLTLADGETTILLNAGQGTTGTSTAMEATCRLGIPSFHYIFSCVPSPPRLSRSNEYFRQYNFLLSQKKALHDKLMKNYFFYRNCAYSRNNSWWHWLFRTAIVQCTMQNLEAALAEDKENLKEMLQQPGNFALHDSPYPYFLDYILQQAQSGDRSISLMISEREPVVWSSRRISEHPEVIVCREQFHEIIHTDAKPNASVENDFYYAGAFDLITCVEHARKQDPPPQFVSDVLITYSGLQAICDSHNHHASECHSRLGEINARALQDYQDRVQQAYTPEYTINLWDKKVTTAEVAMDIYKQLPRLHHMVNRVELVLREGREDGKVLPLVHA